MIEVLPDHRPPAELPPGWVTVTLGCESFSTPVRVRASEPYADPDAIVDEPEPPEPALPDNDPVPDDRPPEEYA